MVTALAARRRTRRARSAARRQPASIVSIETGTDLPGRRADPRDRPACASCAQRGRDRVGRLNGLPHLRRRRAARRHRRPARARRHAAERLRHDRDLLAPIHAADRRRRPAIIETCGRACPGYEMRICRPDDPDVELPAGEIGQIGGRGASLMLGYFDDQAATEDCVQCGRLVHDRRSRLARRRRLSAHHRAQEGRHHPRRAQHLSGAHRGPGDAPSGGRARRGSAGQGRAARRKGLPRRGVARAARPVDAEQVLAHLEAQGLSRYDMPEFLLELEQIPLTASGKIRKRDIVDWIEEGRASPRPVRWKPGTRET